MEAKPTKTTRRERFLRYAPLFLWIALILYLSGSGGSFGTTSRFIGPLLTLLMPGASAETLEFYHGILRKLAHPTIYAILAFWAARAFAGSSVRRLREWPLVAAFILVMTVSIIDELNQSFLSSRTGSASDVGLDLAGAVVMLSFIWFVRAVPRNLKR